MPIVQRKREYTFKDTGQARWEVVGETLEHLQKEVSPDDLQSIDHLSMEWLEGFIVATVVVTIKL